MSNAKGAGAPAVPFSPALERVPPTELAAEEAILGMILCDDEGPATAAVCRRLLSPGDFYREAHRAIFDAAATLSEAGRGTDVVHVESMLTGRGQLDLCGGMRYLLNLSGARGLRSQLRHYCSLVKVASLKRQLIDISSQVAGAAGNGTEPAQLSRWAAHIAGLTAGIARRGEAVERGIMSAEDLMRMELPAPRWAVPDLVPEGLTLLVGKPKVKKSWLALQLGLSIAAAGRALGATDVEGGEVLYLSLEDKPRRLQARIHQLMDGQAIPGRLFLATDWPRWDEGGHSELAGWLTDHPGTRLVMVDTLAKVRGARDPKAQLYDEDYQAISDMKRLADSFGIGLMIVHHQRKGQAEDVFDTASGSLGLTGAADAMLFMTRLRNDAGQAATLHVTGRDVPERELALEWDDHAGWQLRGDASDFARSQADREVMALFTPAGLPINAASVSTALGVPTPTARQRLFRMAQRGLLVGQDGWFRPAVATRQE